MTKTASAPRNPATADPNVGQFIERLMAISGVERRFIATEPQLREEIGFQVVALILCPFSLGYSIYKVALSLLGYSTDAALEFAIIVAFGLFTLDRHYLIQARGDSSERVRKAIYKIRAVSVAIISMSFMLTATYTFQDEIDQILSEDMQLHRTELEQSPRYKLERDDARDAVDRARLAIKRADELRAHVAQLQIQQAAAWEEHTNQCEGNTTGNRTRKQGCGPEARGFEAVAKRIEREIQTANQELTQLSPVSELLPAAKQQLAAVETRIDQDAARSVSGSKQRVDALMAMLERSWSARFVVMFWFLIGLVPDMLMYAAQSRMCNHDLFVRMRALQNEHLEARIAQLRRELRQQQADKLAPIEVRLEAVAQPASWRTSDTAVGRRQQ